MKKIKLLIRSLLAVGILMLAVKTQAQDTTSVKNNHHKYHHEFNMNNVKVEHHGKDTTIVIIHHDHNGNIGRCSMMCRKGRYNGHWAGIELGWNGYLNSNNNMTFPSNQRYLDLNSSRSMTVNINPVELNLNIAKNHFGLTSGLGLTFNNYFFSSSTLLIHDSSSLVAYKLVDQNGNKADMRTNKLTVVWLTLPLMLEYQTNSGIRWNSFHISAGVVGGLRLGAYTKQSFYSRYTTYYLQDQDGVHVGSVYVDNHSTRTVSQYHLNPFKLDASVRIGWSFLNFFANYSITEMFQQDQGPALYPFELGITLCGW
jgi:hypothetical protein